MKLNKNGWGTMEMFALSGGLLLALLVAIFFISRLYGTIGNSVENKNYIDLENKIESAGRNYVKDFGLTISGDTKITLSTLKNYGYINDFTDEKGNYCNGYVLITKIDNINHYNGYVLCDEYQTKNY